MGSFGTQQGLPEQEVVSHPIRHSRHVSERLAEAGLWLGASNVISLGLRAHDVP